LEHRDSHNDWATFRGSAHSADERAELVRLRRELRVKDMEIEILKRASVFFARENVLPK
jgi:transposase-like protein